MIQLVIRLLIELQKSQELRHKIVQKQSQIENIDFNRELERYIFSEKRQQIIDDLRLIN